MMSAASGHEVVRLPLRCERLQVMLSVLREANPGTIYIVGGFLRDACLGREPSRDMDLVLPNIADFPVHLTTARHHGWQGFVLDETRASLRLLWRSQTADTEALTMDLTPLDRDGIDADLARRDCTANAMALEILDITESAVTGYWWDPFGGRSDLAARLLRPVALDNLLADPIRMVRMFRLGHVCDLELDRDMIRFIQRWCHKVARVHPVRLRAEVWTLLTHAHRPVSHVLQQLDDTGLLDQLLPCWPVEEIGDALHLTCVQALTVMDRIQVLACHDPTTLSFWWHQYPVTNTLDQQLRQAVQAPLGAGFTRRQWWLYLGYLLVRGLSRPSGSAHARSGPVSGSVSDYMQASGFSRRQSQHVRAVMQGCVKVLTHLMQSDFRPAERRILHRLRMQLGWTRKVSVVVDIISVLDAVTAVVPLTGLNTQCRFHMMCRSMLALLADTGLDKPRPLVSGTDLQCWLGLPPGPAMGHLLAQLLEAQACRIVSTPEEAKRFVKEVQ